MPDQDQNPALARVRRRAHSKRSEGFGGHRGARQDHGYCLSARKERDRLPGFRVPGPCSRFRHLSRLTLHNGQDVSSARELAESHGETIIPRKLVTRGLAGLAILGAPLVGAVALSGSAGAANVTTSRFGNCSGQPDLGVVCLKATNVNGTYVGSFQVVGVLPGPSQCWLIQLVGPDDNLLTKKSGCKWTGFVTIVIGTHIYVPALRLSPARLIYKVNGDVQAGTYYADFGMQELDPSAVTSINIPSS